MGPGRDLHLGDVPQPCLELVPPLPPPRAVPQPGAGPAWSWSRLVPGAQEAPWQPHFLPAEQARVWTGTSLGLPLGLSRQPTCRCPGLVTAWPSLSPAPAPARRGVQPGPLQPQRHRPVQAQVPGARRRAAPARLPRVADDPPVLPVPALHQHPAAQPAHRHVQVSADSLPPPTLPTPTPPRSARPGPGPWRAGCLARPALECAGHCPRDPSVPPGTAAGGPGHRHRSPWAVLRRPWEAGGARGGLAPPAPGDCGGLWAAGRGPPSRTIADRPVASLGASRGRRPPWRAGARPRAGGARVAPGPWANTIGVARFRSSGRKHYFSVARERGRRS